MSSHPINLLVRFALEIAALVALGFWGWATGTGLLRFVLAVGVPLVAAVLWGTFRVPNDPGAAPVAIPGVLRLVLELTFFAAATWALYDAGAIPLGWLLGIVVLVHYVVSYDRVRWLIEQ